MAVQIATRAPQVLLSPYPSSDVFDEMFAPDGQPRSSAAGFVERLESLEDGSLQQQQKTADWNLQNMGITFNVYDHKAGTGKVGLFDRLPRIIDA